MANELAIVNKGADLVRSVDDVARIGKAMAESGYFSDARTAAQCAVKIMAGLEMGVGPFAAMTGVHIIQGKPAPGANLMASAVKSHPRYDYRVREMSTECVRIEFFDRGDSIGVSEFTFEDARKAGTKNLDKFARNMLFARAMSNGVRWYCPDVFNGTTAYTPEELGEPVYDIEVAEAEPAPEFVDTYDPAEDVARAKEELEAHTAGVPEPPPPPEPALPPQQAPSAGFFVGVVAIKPREIGDKKRKCLILETDYTPPGEKYAEGIFWWKGRDELIQAAPWLGEQVTKEQLGEMGTYHRVSNTRAYYSINGKGHKQVDRFERID